MDLDYLKSVLQLMRDSGVENFELESLKVTFGEARLTPIVHQETAEERLERMKRDFKAAQQEEAELLDWSK